MKNIIKITIFIFSLVTLFSCENDKDPVVTPNGLILSKDLSIVTPTVLSSSLNSDVFTNLNWNKTDNGVASVSTYSIIISDHDADPTFKDAVEYTGLGLNVTPENRSCTLKVEEFNDLMNLLPTYKCTEMNIDIRVKSKLGIAENAFYQYSNPVTYSVTSYSTKKQQLAVVKDGSTPADALKLASSSSTSVTDFEGYMFLTAGTYKLYQPDACYSYASPTIYGGTSATALQVGAASIAVATDGFYLVKANLTNLSYSIKNYNAVAVFGAATRAVVGFGNSVPMTYNTTSKVWEITMDLIKGKKFKFKSILWTGSLVIPPATATLPAPPYTPNATTTTVSIFGGISGSMNLEENATTGNGDITVPGILNGNETQKYLITVDLNNPRGYTYTMKSL